MQERRAVAPLTAGTPDADAAPTGRRPTRLAIVAGVAAIVVTADQLAKTWAEHHLADRSIHIVWTLRLSLSYNTGAAFSLGRGYGPYIMLLGVSVLVVFLGMARNVLLRSLLLTVALGLVLGGALGNVGDRLLRANGGAVIDFIDLQWWPVFNVADSALSVGAVLLAIGGRKAS